MSNPKQFIFDTVEHNREAIALLCDNIGETEYRPLLPPDQKPPLDLNRALMERFRPAMREHYLRDKPVFG